MKFLRLPLSTGVTHKHPEPKPAPDPRRHHDRTPCIVIPSAVGPLPINNRLHRAHLRSLSLLTALCALASVAGAQTAAANPPVPDETIKLSPFTVNTEKDNGYIAADSLMGGRLATPLLKTPSDITVLTRDFLDDVGATDYQRDSRVATE